MQPKKQEGERGTSPLQYGDQQMFSGQKIYPSGTEAKGSSLQSD